MYIKEQFELMYGKQGAKVYNIVPIGESSLSAFEIHAEEQMYVKNLAKIYIRSKQAVGSDIISKHLNTCKLVQLKNYPLPAFVSKDGHGYINLSVFSSDDVSDYSPTDIYALYLYTVSLTLFITKKGVPDGIEEQVFQFIYAIFMKLFRKKSGLSGARELMPKFAFIIWLYVHTAMFGYNDDENARNKIRHALYTSTEDLKLNYDFSTTTGFLNAINDNGIVSISANKFSTEIINRGNIPSLPMFEDVSRFFSSLLACTIPGSRIFSNSWSKIRPDLFKILVAKSLMFLERID